MRLRGDVVGTLSATDPDTVGTLTYTIVDAATATRSKHSLFEIVGNEVRVKAGLDYEAAGAPHDQGEGLRRRERRPRSGLSRSRSMMSTTTLRRTLVLAGATVAENAAVGKMVGTLSVTRPGHV